MAQIVNEPVLVYDVSGSTIAGPFNQSLVVYNNGTAKISEVSQLGGADAAVTFVGSSIDVAPVTVVLANVTGSRGQDWHILTAAAFVTMILPLRVSTGALVSPLSSAKI